MGPGAFGGDTLALGRRSLGVPVPVNLTVAEEASGAVGAA